MHCPCNHYHFHHCLHLCRLYPLFRLFSLQKNLVGPNIASEMIVTTLGSPMGVYTRVRNNVMFANGFCYTAAFAHCLTVYPLADLNSNACVDTLDADALDVVPAIKILGNIYHLSFVTT